MGPTDQVGGAAAAGSCAGGVEFAAVPPEALGSAVEGVCASAGSISTELIKKAAKHFENTVIPISPSRSAWLLGKTTLPSLWRQTVRAAFLERQRKITIRRIQILRDRQNSDSLNAKSAVGELACARA